MLLSTAFHMELPKAIIQHCELCCKHQQQRKDVDVKLNVNLQMGPPQHDVRSAWPVCRLLSAFPGLVARPVAASFAECPVCCLVAACRTLDLDAKL